MKNENWMKPQKDSADVYAQKCGPHVDPAEAYRQRMEQRFGPNWRERVKPPTK